MQTDLTLSKESISNTVRRLNGITVDFGGQRISRENFCKLISLGKQKNLLESFKLMRDGAIVNPSENRPALHTTLRNSSLGTKEARLVQETLCRMYDFADGIRSGKVKGCRGQTINHVVNIGIGGSYLGPKAVYEALREPKQEIKLSFLSSSDGVLFDRIMAELDPFRTLFVISSKSFTTAETMVNAEEVIGYLKELGMTSQDLEKHVVTVSTKSNAGELLGLPGCHHFPIWDWVGGRFSVWSAIGIPLVIALGKEVFQAFLEGAKIVDDHTENTPIEKNIPALLALFDYWNLNELDIPSVCFLPYDERLNLIGAWRQQLEMESLGKSVLLDGTQTERKTCPIIWDGNGDESQHSFFQWVREGTGNTALELVTVKEPGHRHQNLYKQLIRNAEAQSQALLQRNSDKYFNVMTRFKIERLTPGSLGTLMAIYENKVALLGAIYGLNPFDQPGVELGKKLAREGI